MKILVTGGTGFTGSNLVMRLLSKGHEVTAFDNQEGIVLGQLKAKGAEIVIGSITDTGLLPGLVKGKDAVFHLAAAFRQVNLPKTVYWQTNVDAMSSLLEAAQAAGVKKIVYCSTQGVHGNVKNPPGDENSPITPEDYYQYTKYEGEKAAMQFLEKGMDITILRPTAIYGPGDPARFLMLYRRVATGVFPFFGNGKALYHPLYIDNFMDAFELALEKPGAKGQTYIIADEKYFTIEEIVRTIAEIMNVDLKTPHYPFWPMYAGCALVELLYKPLPFEPPLFRRRADWFRQNRAFKIDKAKRELGYNPGVDLKTGLTRTLEWYNANKYLER